MAMYLQVESAENWSKSRVLPLPFCRPQPDGNVCALKHNVYSYHTTMPRAAFYMPCDCLANYAKYGSILVDIQAEIGPESKRLQSPRRPPEILVRHHMI